MAVQASKSGNIGVPFAAIVTTDATGQASVAFPAGRFAAVPVVVASAVNEANDGRDIVVTLVGVPTISGCTVLARKSRPLPATILNLTNLQGYDIFTPVSVKVEVLARVPS